MKPQNGSYPYLRIAKEYGLDYGDVLLCADRVRGGSSSRVHQIMASERVYQHLTEPEFTVFEQRIIAQVNEFERIQAEGWD